MDSEKSEPDKPKKKGITLADVQEVYKDINLEDQVRSIQEISRRIDDENRALGRITLDYGLFSPSINFSQDISKAINEVATADPNNIQEVVASQIATLSSYYKSGLGQSQQSFFWSLIWGGIGTTLLFATIIAVLFFQKSWSDGLITGVSGAVVEIFAGTYAYLYKNATDQLAAYRVSLEKNTNTTSRL